MSFPSADSIRILIVDDHALFREGLAELLNKSPEFRVIGQCGSSSEALGLIKTGRPLIVLLDFDLGAERAFDFLDRVPESDFDGRVVILTAGVSEPEAIQLVQAGVAGILHKHNSVEALLESIRRVAKGGVCLEKNYLKPLFRSVDQSHSDGSVKLTDREKKLLRLVFQGLSNKEIGGKLDLAEGTVKAALRQLFQKVGVRTRAQLVKVALEEYRDQL